MTFLLYRKSRQSLQVDVRKEYKVFSVPKKHLKCACSAAENVINFAIWQPDLLGKMHKNVKKTVRNRYKLLKYVSRFTLCEYDFTISY
jgi:hypothetical protein